MPHSVRMRRLFVLTLLLSVPGLGMVGLSVPVSAGGGFVEGRLATSTSGASLSGYTVRLRADDSGVAAASTTSAGDGSFVLMVPPVGGSYYVQVVGTSRWQGGWAGGSTPAHIEFSFDSPATSTYVAGDDLGNLRLPPAWMRGTVVDAATGNPVRGVEVAVKRPGGKVALAIDMTGPKGGFYVEGLDEEEFDVRVDGSARGYETGFWTCASTVTPDRGDACTVGYGNRGKVRIQRLP